MISKIPTLSRFKSKVLVRVLLLVVLLCLSAFMFFKNDSLFLGSVFILSSIGVAISIFRIVNKTNRNLANFLMGIKYDDFETNYREPGQEEGEKALFGAFNLINTKFRDIRIEKEIQAQYFQTIVENVDNGLIGFDHDGKCIFMNRALKAVLRKSFFPTFGSIQKYDQGLYDLLADIKAGEQGLYKKEIDQENVHLSVKKTQIKIRDSNFDIYSFHNIHAELQAQEIRSWQKIIRVLTHEIMNSVSPVISLANSTNDLLSNETLLDDEAKKEVHAAVRAIQKRSKGLMNFTETYRKLTKVPLPKMEILHAQELLDRVILLMKPKMKEDGISLEKQYSKREIRFQGDAIQLEQVFINLLKNGMEALSGEREKRITVSAEKRDGKIFFRFADTGPGIPPDLLEQIFVPFFTTKAEGSGIGLSLCRQIIYQHGGTLSVFCPQRGGTVFTVSL